MPASVAPQTSKTCQPAVHVLHVAPARFPFTRTAALLATWTTPSHCRAHNDKLANARCLNRLPFHLNNGVLRVARPRHDPPDNIRNMDRRSACNIRAAVNPMGRGNKHDAWSTARTVPCLSSALCAQTSTARRRATISGGWTANSSMAAASSTASGDFCRHGVVKRGCLAAWSLRSLRSARCILWKTEPQGNGECPLKRSHITRARANNTSLAGALSRASSVSNLLGRSDVARDAQIRAGDAGTKRWSSLMRRPY